MQFDLQTLYPHFFGIEFRRYPEFDTTQQVLPYLPASNMPVFETTTDNELKSIFGTPIFMPLKIDDMWLPNEPLITLTGGKNIVRTVVTGLKGTVKEEINTDDYLIVIRGIITNDTSDDYPEAIVSQLRHICEAQGSHQVVNKLLKIYGIDQIVMEHYQIFGIEGHQSQQAYQISAWSDRTVELVIKEGL